jgi:hypothetical protein
MGQGAEGFEGGIWNAEYRSSKLKAESSKLKGN